MILVNGSKGIGTGFSTRIPSYNPIDIINNLYDSGNTVIFQTARGMGSNQNNSKIAGEKWREITLLQLEKWGVRYHQLFLGKPAGDIYIDDKGQSDTTFFQNFPGKDV
jgi:hypothetical protein